MIVFAHLTWAINFILCKKSGHPIRQNLTWLITIPSVQSKPEIIFLGNFPGWLFCHGVLITDHRYLALTTFPFLWVIMWWRMLMPWVVFHCLRSPGDSTTSRACSADGAFGRISSHSNTDQNVDQKRSIVVLGISIPPRGMARSMWWPTETLLVPQNGALSPWWLCTLGKPCHHTTSRLRGGARRAACRTSWHFSNEDFGKNVCVVARYGWRHSEDSSIMPHLPTVQASTSSSSSPTVEMALPSMVTLALGLCWTVPRAHVSSGGRCTFEVVRSIPDACSHLSSNYPTTTSLICPVWPTTDDRNR